MALSSQSTKFWCSIDLGDTKREHLEILKDIESWLILENTHYAMIYHHDEVSLDTGELERPHIHICAQGFSKKHMLSWYMNRLDDVTHLGVLHIHKMDIWKSYELGIRYLIHKDHPLKKQYEREQIITNIDKDELNYILDSEVLDNTMSMEKIFKLVADNNYCLIDVMRSMTLGQYLMYRNVIIDIIKYYR